MTENQLILIADDFGMSKGINRGILELLDDGLISGTSAMVNMPNFTEAADSLAERDARADLGLHLNLTLGRPLTHMPRSAPTGEFQTIADMTKQSLFGSLDVAELSEEIFQQIQYFRSHTGFLPRFIDGHQHVHILPRVRVALFDALERFTEYRPWIRNPFDHPIAIFARQIEIKKSFVLAALALGFGSQAQSRGYRTNTSFSGASNFDPEADYSEMFSSYLKSPSSIHLVMCHPGYVATDETLPDPVRDTRPIELRYFKSAEFQTALDRAGMTLSRFPIS